MSQVEGSEVLTGITGKRTDYISWEELFMGTAILAGLRSKDPQTQVGACIVDPDNKIVGIGYNGMPIGCSDDLFPWTNTSDKYQSKKLYVCHAEMNAILNKNVVNLKGCTIYVGLFPCNECAKIIIQSGIKEVIYNSDKKFGKVETKASKRMFDETGVKYRQYTSKRDAITIDFNKH
jgi:dCMP deaminase